VLPAAASLKRQGANTGATTAFMISTPESGVDSITLSYALLDPVMTVARPAAAMATAVAAGLAENLLQPPSPSTATQPDLSCPVDGCCDGKDCPPAEHARHHTWAQRLRAGLNYALGELWADLAGWFFVGLILAGLITALVPEDFFRTYLGGGLGTMLAMLAMGIPLYICASASTPIAAALILKGVSPGAALVFLLAGPATNITSLTMMVGILGKRATAIYLGAIALGSVLCGLMLDKVYGLLDISAQAVAGQAAELMPLWARWAGALFLLAISLVTVMRRFRRQRNSKAPDSDACAITGPKVLPLSPAEPAPQGPECSGST
jgi:hypothetical protein